MKPFLLKCIDKSIISRCQIPHSADVHVGDTVKVIDVDSEGFFVRDAFEKLIYLKHEDFVFEPVERKVE